MTTPDTQPSPALDAMPRTVRRITLTADEADSLLSAWGHAGAEHHDDCPSLKSKMSRLRQWLHAPNQMIADKLPTLEPGKGFEPLT